VLGCPYSGMLINSYYIFKVLQHLQFLHQAVEEEWKKVTGRFRTVHKKNFYDLYTKNRKVCDNWGL
jgi:hypothetical protein